jgi:hypothetical protein
MEHTMKAVALILAGLLGSTAAMAAVTVDNPPPAPGTIIWNDSPPPPSAPAGTPDKNGIIWDAPSSAKAPAASATVPPPASTSGATKQESIIWDTPRTASANAPKPLVPPPPVAGAAAQASGECREFQTTIVIDGQRQPAHGTACRQADGSWRVTR